MRNTLGLLLVAVILLLIFAGCNKDSTKTPAVPKSNWTINGVTYNEGTTATSYSGGDLTAIDNAQNGSVTVQFLTKPTMNSTFTITDLSDTSILSSTSCIIYATIPPATNFTSANNSGHAVSVTVDAGGKLTATFSGVAMKSTTTSNKSISGTIIEK
jgi:hypothetical protein